MLQLFAQSPTNAKFLLGTALGIGLAMSFTAGTPRAQGDLRERTVYASVINKAAEPVDGLGNADFVVREDGLRREVLRVTRATEPIDLAVLVDNASTSGDLIPRVREGLKRLVAAVTPAHAVALVALADRPTILVDYTTNAATLQSGIGRLFTMSSSGATVLDGIFEVADGLRRREATRAVILPIITDGEEYWHRRYPDVLSALQRSGASLYPVLVGRFSAGTTDEKRGRMTVLNLGPDRSGGHQTSPLSAVSVDKLLERLGRQLTSQYKIVYSRPETLIPPEKVTVTTAQPGFTVSAAAARTTTGSNR